MTETFKLLHRENGGKMAFKKTTFDYDLVEEFKDYKSAEEYMENLITKNEAKQNRVYVIEKWINNKRIPLSGVYSDGQFCRTFWEKWVWDSNNEWHTTSYIHKSEYDFILN